MKNLIIYNCLGLFIIINSFSCSDNFLERSPLTAISDVAVWSDLGLIEAYVNEVYSKIPHGFENNLASISDECYRVGSSYETYNLGGANGANPGPVNQWTNYYSIITDINNLFENLDRDKLALENPENEHLYSRILGEAHFLRGYAFFKLVSFYGDIPFFTAPFKLTDDFSLERTDYESVLNFVVDELDESTKYLSIDYDSNNKGRITKGAALGLKSRVLLYWASPLWNKSNDISMWEKAATAAKEVIDMNEYSLVDNYSEIFDVDDDKERMFWIKFDNKIESRHDLEQAWFPNGSAGRGHFHILQNAVDDFESSRGLLPKEDPEYNPQDPYIDRDPRFYDIVLFNGAAWQNRNIETFIPKGDDSLESATNAESGSRTGYFVRKFVKEEIRNPTFSNVSNTPWIIMRYAEILLNYAEANYFLGNEDITKRYLNMIRKRKSVNMPEIFESGENLFQRLMNERRIELFMEEHRWFDLRRWMVAGDILNFEAERVNIVRNENNGDLTFEVKNLEKRTFPNYYYLAPIPQSELEKNPKLLQNPGY